MVSQALFAWSSLIILAFFLVDVLITSSVQEFPPSFRCQAAFHDQVDLPRQIVQVRRHMPFRFFSRRRGLCGALFAYRSALLGEQQ